MLHTVDLVVIVAYLAATAWLGLKLSGKQKGLRDYFLGSRKLPWWAVCLSVVATETSALTVVGTPVMSFLGNISFLQMAIGYLLGRIVVAFLMLPRYYDGEMVTAYAYLGKRFGQSTQTTAGVTFLFTRLLADGVRVLAAAIPLKLILDGMGIPTNYFTIIVVLAVVTIAYTFIGGIKAVVWVDVAQMLLYVLGGILAIVVISVQTGGGWLTDAAEAGKLQMFVFSGNPISDPSSFIPSVLGGAVFAMASHGADQLVVQRLLACRSKVEAQKAIIWSGVVVFFQFAVFLLVGLALWGYYDQRTPADLGLVRDDEIFPLFIIEGLPQGLSGLLLAAILAAAMSTLSSSLSALSSSTVTDVYAKLRRSPVTDEQGLRVGRWATIGWGLAFIAPAVFFQSDEGNIVVLALGIAGITYGGLLGAFVFGIFNKRARAKDANIAFVAAIGVNLYFFVMEKYVTGEIWLAWQWYPLLGVIVTFAVGGLLSLRHPAVPADERATERVG
ncbi:sodium:solute symporter [Isoptericola halotolerans]|uniref:SSS family transporter n=1 Tax=Isoptericola halotolerans TaxID=300560 RepID=A0ABX2A7P2_9MICO|nr:sodium:solute symporter [Isoptericola halotolerans]NOV98828.1 SSS family transporter [Isoptericola halotolerans]